LSKQCFRTESSVVLWISLKYICACVNSPLRLEQLKFHYLGLLQENRANYTVSHPVKNLTEANQLIVKEVERPCNLKKKKQSSCRARRYTNELLKYEGEYVLTLLKDICNEILTGDDIPQEWNSAYMCCIYVCVCVCVCVCIYIYIYIYKVNTKFCKSYRGKSIINSTRRFM